MFTAHPTVSNRHRPVSNSRRLRVVGDEEQARAGDSDLFGEKVIDIVGRHPV